MKTIFLVAIIVIVICCIALSYNLYQHKINTPRYSFGDHIDTGRCYIAIGGKKKWVFVSKGEMIDNQSLRENCTKVETIKEGRGWRTGNAGGEI